MVFASRVRTVKPRGGKPSNIVEAVRSEDDARELRFQFARARRERGFLVLIYHGYTTVQAKQTKKQPKFPHFGETSFSTQILRFSYLLHDIPHSLLHVNQVTQQSVECAQLAKRFRGAFINLRLNLDARYGLE